MVGRIKIFCCWFWCRLVMNDAKYWRFSANHARYSKSDTPFRRSDSSDKDCVKFLIRSSAVAPGTINTESPVSWGEFTRSMFN